MREAHKLPVGRQIKAELYISLTNSPTQTNRQQSVLVWKSAAAEANSFSGYHEAALFRLPPKSSINVA